MRPLKNTPTSLATFKREGFRRFAAREPVVVKAGRAHLVVYIQSWDGRTDGGLNLTVVAPVVEKGKRNGRR